MSFDLNHEQDLRDLQEQIRRACTITPALMADVIGRACPRLQSQHRSAKARIIRLLESGAFADAMLALLEFELPLWKLRRLIREDDEWHCSISKQLGLPAEFDEMAEASHEGLPLAILSAFVEARRHSFTAGEGPAKIRAAGPSHTGIRHLLRQFRLIGRPRAVRRLRGLYAALMRTGRIPPRIHMRT